MSACKTVITQQPLHKFGFEEPPQKPAFSNVTYEPNFGQTTRTGKYGRNECHPCKGPYTYGTSPRTLPNKRTVCKPTMQYSSQPFQNVMFDKRICRGSNYTAAQIATSEINIIAREKEAARRNQIRRKTLLQRTQRGIIGTPPPVKGRKHEPVQTEKYIEELFSRVPERDATCQTDLFLHRPPSPPYIPAKTGRDVSTDINDGDLFVFETEVQPILETLVGKTVEQSLLEVLHEEELADMKEQQQKYLAIREAELARLRRLEEQEKRFQAEKELRLTQDKISSDLDREMQERTTAAKLLQGHIAELLPGVLHNIEKITEEENIREMERELAPWLAKEVAAEVGQMIDSRDLLEEIVREILQQRAEVYMAMMSTESVASISGEGEEEAPEESVIAEDTPPGDDES